MSQPNPPSEVHQPYGDAAGAAASQTSTLPRLDSRKLFGGANELLIEHGEELYRLRWTRSGKLILTK